MAAGYTDTREKILNALCNRPNGKEIQPEDHQAFALSLLEYIRSVELISGSTLIGVAQPDTVPVQPNNSHTSYIAGIAQQRNVTFTNFRDKNGNAITISTGEMEAKLIVLTWNQQYWDYAEVEANIISQADKAYFFYALTIRKTYGSVADMNADKNSPIGNDGKSIKVGEVVSVHNDSDTSQDAIYSLEKNASGYYWQLQMRLSALDSRTLDGGRADTVYGGALNIDCGTAN